MGRPKLDNVRVQVRFTPKQIAAIDALAKLLRETRIGIIQRAVKDHIEHLEQSSPKKGTA